MQSYNNHAYMHGYYSIVIYMHNFTSTDVSVFLVKMCKISHFLYFAQFYTDVVALKKQLAYVVIKKIVIFNFLL